MQSPFFEEGVPLERAVKQKHDRDAVATSSTGSVSTGGNWPDWRQDPLTRDQPTGTWRDHVPRQPALVYHPPSKVEYVYKHMRRGNEFWFYVHFEDTDIEDDVWIKMDEFVDRTPRMVLRQYLEEHRIYPPGEFL